MGLGFKVRARIDDLYIYIFEGEGSGLVRVRPLALYLRTVARDATLRREGGLPLENLAQLRLNLAELAVDRELQSCGQREKRCSSCGTV